VLLVLLAGCAASPASSPSTHHEPPTLREQLQLNDAVRDEMLGGLPVRGEFRCGLDVLGHDDSRSYVWLQSEDHGGGSAGTGSALPAVVTTKEGVVIGVRFPRQAHLVADLAAMFPPRIVRRINARDVQPCPAVEPRAAVPDIEVAQKAGQDVLGLLDTSEVSATAMGSAGEIRIMLVGDEGVGQVAAAFETEGCPYTVWLRAGTTIEEAQAFLAAAY
jgi:hypothetical protein